ncbi:MAG TPA: HEAT repeat domain-containing protein, partial [Verrucomicrobiae bacterium]|nr:HEAT repeat domain-containing protein [Verrucomicrobiae bacterium]
MMRKRVQIAVACLLAVSVGLAGWWLFRVREVEPVYQGKTLRDWLWDAYNGADRAAVAEAVRGMGTNTLPVLLTMIQAKDSLFGRQLINVWQSSIENIRCLPDSVRHPEWYRHQPCILCSGAQQGFEILGRQAQAAAPDLIAIYNRNISEMSQTAASRALIALGPAGRAAIPSFLRKADSTDETERSTAIWALLRIKAEPEVITPVLTRCLTDTNRMFRWIAATGLPSLG